MMGFFVATSHFSDAMWSTGRYNVSQLLVSIYEPHFRVYIVMLLYSILVTVYSLLTG